VVAASLSEGRRCNFMRPAFGWASSRLHRRCMIGLSRRRQTQISEIIVLGFEAEFASL